MLGVSSEAKSSIYGILPLSNLLSSSFFGFTSTIKITSNNTTIIIMFYLHIRPTLRWKSDDELHFLLLGFFKYVSHVNNNQIETRHGIAERRSKNIYF